MLSCTARARAVSCVTGPRPGSPRRPLVLTAAGGAGRPGQLFSSLPHGGGGAHGCSTGCSHLLLYGDEGAGRASSRGGGPCGLCGRVSGGDQGQIVEGKPHGRPPAGVRWPLFLSFFFFQASAKGLTGRLCRSWVDRGPSGALFSALGTRVFRNGRAFSHPASSNPAVNWIAVKSLGSLTWPYRARVH